MSPSPYTRALPILALLLPPHTLELRPERWYDVLSAAARPLLTLCPELPGTRIPSAIHRGCRGWRQPNEVPDYLTSWIYAHVLSLLDVLIPSTTRARSSYAPSTTEDEAGPGPGLSADAGQVAARGMEELTSEERLLAALPHAVYILVEDARGIGSRERTPGLGPPVTTAYKIVSVGAYLVSPPTAPEAIC
ncbi:hypothetical protein FA95DRAFT_1575207 [Auriscalpium vulgare]|uniref:Uncharacterized protein n=1 Tax=Auriscalpium vulgare TaxID=40419 RepID=A0ACB8RID5_9AGAM|nr:hypothetical protein FA95DRAFT_1575207 [Auriscalpium vulgare]